jgi:hypothetical protein
MRAFIFVAFVVALAAPAVAVPVNDQQKRQSGTFDYIIVGVSSP